MFMVQFRTSAQGIPVVIPVAHNAQKFNLLPGKGGGVGDAVTDWPATG